MTPSPSAAMLASTVQYPGGKNGCGTWQRLISMMPPHEVYVEAFLGSGAVLRRKRPAPRLNLGIEIVAAAIAEFSEAVRIARSGETTRLINAEALSILSSSPAMADPKTLVYCDPPYLHARFRYRCDPHFTCETFHRRLLAWAVDARCMVMISAYESRLYTSKLAGRSGWRCERFPSMTRGGVRTECVWCNFPVPSRLHDPRFIGDGFRARERLKRRSQRWASRFASMTPAERQVVAAALVASDPTSVELAIAAAGPIAGSGDGIRR